MGGGLELRLKVLPSSEKLCVAEDLKRGDVRKDILSVTNHTTRMRCGGVSILVAVVIVKVQLRKTAKAWPGQKLGRSRMNMHHHRLEAHASRAWDFGWPLTKAGNLDNFA